MKNEFNKLCDVVKKNLIFDLDIPERKSEEVRNNYVHLDRQIGKYIFNRILFRKARFVSIELIENVLRYGYFNGKHKSYVAIAFRNNKLYLSSSNLVKNDEIEYIETRLNEINKAYSSAQPHQVLRQMYREKLSQVGIADNNVKIGILELARRIDDKILFQFDKADDTYSVFSIICTINVENNTKS